MANDNSTQKLTAENCFVCGENNTGGLQITFHIENDACHGEFTPTERYVGFGNVVHGGIIYAVLDDAMANWFFLRGAFGYTAKAEIRYRSHLLIGDTGLISYHLINKKGKLLLLSSQIKSKREDKLIAECDGSFIISSPGPLID